MGSDYETFHWLKKKKKKGLCMYNSLIEHCLYYVCY